jgi:hypothetical protein
VKHLLGFKQGLIWLTSLNNPDLNDFASHLFNVPESVWSQWLVNSARPPRELRGKMSFLLTQIVLAPGLRRSTGVNPRVAWRHYSKLHRKRHPIPSVIATRIASETEETRCFDSLTEALIWYWLLEMGYPVPLPYYLCHQVVILGLHLVRAHIALDDLALQLHCDYDLLDQMLGGHVVLSPIGACQVMELDAKLAHSYPPGSRHSNAIPV